MVSAPYAQAIATGRTKQGKPGKVCTKEKEKVASVRTAVFGYAVGRHVIWSCVTVVCIKG